MNVSRYTKQTNTELRFDVEFITPTFLGGADRNAEIRTAPFKNLLRCWWRIANGNLSPEELWKKESRLFGSTEKDPDVVEENKKLPKEKRKPETFGKSKVCLTIVSKNIEYQKEKSLRFPDKKIIHPEVHNIKNPKVLEPVSFEAYLGMGPVFGRNYNYMPILEYVPSKKVYDDFSKKEVTVPERKSSITISLSLPASEKERFIEVLSYINYFGTIGSRSRNGWGSILVKNIVLNENEQLELIKIKDIKEKKAVDWQSLINGNCSKKYPSAIAKDDKGLLCWCAPQRNSWEEAMLDAAKIYSSVRTQFKFKNNDLNDRHLLGYPITHHEYNNWPVKNTRLPSELCIKINFNQGKYRAQITHIPNLIPLQGFSVEEQRRIWKEVHSFLDKYQIENNKGEKKNLTRFGGAAK